jgi:hypothetical protein
LGTLTSWNPLGHSRPVTGLLYLLVKNKAGTIVYRFKLLIRKLKVCAISHFGSKYDNPEQTTQEFRATALILT